VKILIAEDDPIAFHVLATLLREWGYEVVPAADGNESWELLRQEDGPPLAVLNWAMPGMDGLEVCQRLRQIGKAPRVYILMAMPESEHQNIIAALDGGADDYLGKPFDTQELRFRLHAARRIVDLQEALRLQSAHDVLTGVWNQPVIIEILQRELARAVRSGAPIGVIMADLDHFRAVNESHGPVVGDEVLREVASRMEALIRSYDSVGRYGGEEFVIVLPGCDALTAAGVAERLRHGISASPIETSAEALRITVSLGVTVPPVPVTGKGRKAGELIRNAAAAMQRAKQRGRNRIEID
jgi:two-component system, cell cycle response regulator